MELYNLWNMILNFFRGVADSFNELWNFRFQLGTLSIGFSELLLGSVTLLIGWLLVKKLIF